MASPLPASVGEARIKPWPAWQNRSVPRDRDVRAFHDRAPSYESGWLGGMHHEIAHRTGQLALCLDRTPQRVLDVGCGTGLLLRLLAEGLPGSEELVGVDAATGMIAIASSLASDPRLRFSVGVAEDLQFPDAFFDIVLSTNSFDHWENQGAGLVECARVLSPGGRLVLTDLFSLWLAPTLLVGRRGRARTKHRASELLGASGFHSIKWHRLYALIIKTAVASK